MITEEIKNKILQMKPFYMQNAIHNIFSWTELEHVLNFRPLLSSKRLRLNNSKDYFWYDEGWLTDLNTWPQKILEKELKEYTAFIIDMSKVNKDVNNICAALEEIVGWPTDAHIYFSIVESKKENMDFSPHWDWSHNLIVQVEGISQHIIWNKLAEGHESRFTDYINDEPLIDIMMKPGDITFIPKMFYHEVVSKTKRLSISFPMNPSDGLECQDRTWIKLL